MTSSLLEPVAIRSLASTGEEKRTKRNANVNDGLLWYLSARSLATDYCNDCFQDSQQDQYLRWFDFVLIDTRLSHWVEMVIVILILGLFVVQMSSFCSFLNLSHLSVQRRRNKPSRKTRSVANNDDIDQGRQQGIGKEKQSRKRNRERERKGGRERDSYLDYLRKSQASVSSTRRRVFNRVSLPLLVVAFLFLLAPLSLSLPPPLLSPYHLLLPFVDS